MYYKYLWAMVIFRSLTIYIDVVTFITVIFYGKMYVFAIMSDYSSKYRTVD